MLVGSKSPYPDIPGNGPGPGTLLKYDADNDVGYFGTLADSAFFTYSQIEAAAKTPLPGTAVNRTSANYWIKAYWKGKIIYMPRTVIRSGTSWADIYRAGMIYGIDGPGSYVPTTGAVNQLTTITLTASDMTRYVYKIRAISAYGVNPLPASLLTAQIAVSEYTLIRERLAPSGNAPAGWAWGAIGTISGQTMGYESIAGSPIRGCMVNNNGNYLNRTLWDITTTQFCQFYPVLELIEVIKP